MTLRAQIATELAAVLPSNIKIVDNPRSLDGVEAKRPVVQLYRSRLSKAANALGTYQHTFSIWLVSPNIDPRRSDDTLDEYLDILLPALGTIQYLNWTDAVRSVYGDQQAPAYEITATVLTTP
jgi:hypothetical protein